MVSRMTTLKFYYKNKINFITTFASRGLQQKKGAENTNTEWLFFYMQIQSLNMRILRRFIILCQNRENKEKVGYFHFFFREKKYWS